MAEHSVGPVSGRNRHCRGTTHLEGKWLKLLERSFANWWRELRGNGKLKDKQQTIFRGKVDGRGQDKAEEAEAVLLSLEVTSGRPPMLPTFLPFQLRETVQVENVCTQLLLILQGFPLVQ